MKKVFTTALLVVCLMFTMTGCAKKTSVNIGFSGNQPYRMVEYPAGADTFEFNDLSGLSFTVKKDGQYTVIIKGDEDKKEYTLVITVKDGKVDLQADEDCPASLITK